MTAPGHVAEASGRQMRAVVIAKPGGPEVLELRDVRRPEPGSGQVLVRVRGTALNRADLLQRQGRYPAPSGAPPDIPGLEFAGEIAGLGPDTSLWREGDRVFGIVGGGAHAEYLVAHERALARIPERMSYTDAAAVPEAFITAHDALVTQGSLRSGDAVLVQAVGSGVGLAAVQLARAASAIPYGTSRTASKIERARAHGLESGVVVAGDLDVIPRAAADWTSGNGMRIVLDLVGGPYLGASVRAAANQGCVVLVSTMGGGSAEVPLSVILGKRLTVRGTVLRARPLEEKILATRAFAAEVVPLLATGAASPVIDCVLPLAEVRAAHERMAGNETFGKIVLLV